jgi:hypothetical protein
VASLLISAYEGTVVPWNVWPLIAGATWSCSLLDVEPPDCFLFTAYDETPTQKERSHFLKRNSTRNPRDDRASPQSYSPLHCHGKTGVADLQVPRQNGSKLSNDSSCSFLRGSGRRQGNTPALEANGGAMCRRPNLDILFWLSTQVIRITFPLTPMGSTSCRVWGSNHLDSPSTNRRLLLLAPL